MPSHSIPEPELNLLRRLVASERPAAVLEVGLGSAAATLALLAAGDHELHVCVESDPGAPGVAILDASPERHRVDLRLQPSELALPGLVREGSRFQLALLDGRHLFDHLLVDLFHTDLLLDPGGVVAVDDAHWPGLFRALRYWELNRAYARLPESSRRLAILRKLEDDPRAALPNTWASLGRLHVNF